MHEYHAVVSWSRDDAKFVDGRYSRVHRWSFDGGIVVPASASPLNVSGPYASEAAVDPEEAFAAALSSCHMLFFLFFAAKRGWIVNSYVDNARAVLASSGRGKRTITKVILRPLAEFEGRAPAREELLHVHHEAHEACFLAGSVKSEIVVELPD